MENEKDSIINENRSLAESNLEMEPLLIEIRSRINDLTQEGKELSLSVQEKIQQLSESSIEKPNNDIDDIAHPFRNQIVKPEPGKHA